MTRALIAIGTRPELVKLAPVVRALRAHPGFDVQVLFTGQHRELLDQMAKTFGITADLDLEVMRERQGLAELTGRLVTGLDAALTTLAPDLVLGQGDTTTVFATALACFYRNIPFGHVEAGLRTDDLRRPFPEEGNRRLVAPLTRWHFAPTDVAAKNLLREGVPEAQVYTVGNTVIDALLAIAPTAAPVVPPDSRKLMLLTLHRRESFGAPLRAILEAIRALLLSRPDVLLVYPVHPNPEVRGPAEAILGEVKNARLTAPLDYETFIGTMKAATVVLSDSGGVQEEAPALGVPALVLRDTTERPEGVASGVAWLVGTDPVRIVAEASRWLSADPPPRPTGSPYGDGHAASRIAAILGGATWTPFVWRGG
jgi:UDP-N-acetylglucosamine 2-epimerase (non-hydrolysing)